MMLHESLLRLLQFLPPLMLGLRRCLHPGTHSDIYAWICMHSDRRFDLVFLHGLEFLFIYLFLSTSWLPLHFCVIFQIIFIVLQICSLVWLIGIVDRRFVSGLFYSLGVGLFH